MQECKYKLKLTAINLIKGWNKWKLLSVSIWQMFFLCLPSSGQQIGIIQVCMGAEYGFWIQQKWSKWSCNRKFHCSATPPLQKMMLFTSFNILVHFLCRCDYWFTAVGEHKRAEDSVRQACSAGTPVPGKQLWPFRSVSYIPALGLQLQA